MTAGPKNNNNNNNNNNNYNNNNYNNNNNNKNNNIEGVPADRKADEGPTERGPPPAVFLTISLPLPLSRTLRRIRCANTAAAELHSAIFIIYPCVVTYWQSKSDAAPDSR